MTRSTSRRRANLWPLLALLVLHVGCSQKPRSDDPAPDAGDELVWDSDQDDSFVKEPQLLYETTELAVPQAAFDGERVAVSWTLRDEALEQPSGEPIKLAVFPWQTPELASLGSFSGEPIGCDSAELGRQSQPYPLDGGFLTFTPTRESIDCDAIIAEWSCDAQLVGDPVSVGEVFDDTAVQTFGFTSPSGCIDQDGRILLARITEYAEQAIIYRIDGFTRDGTHEEIVPPTEFPWFDEIGEAFAHIDTSYEFFTYCEGEKVIAITGSHDGHTGKDHHQGIVLAQGETSGEITVPPSVVYKPSGLEGYKLAAMRPAFAKMNDELAVVLSARHQATQTDCLIERYSLLLDLEGHVLTEPLDISSNDFCENITWEVDRGRFDMAWSGQWLGYCYIWQDEHRTIYKLQVLDEEGAPAGVPARLFWDIPGAPIQQGIRAACDVVATGEDSFVVAFYVPERSNAAFSPGVYATVVELTEVY